ncbi:MAG TPA: sigma-70 family RNA polymerase sigma factor [Verrucomicrobiota bacterium]|nr:hypothetical protein [Verrucomicrobiales bacterium]HRI12328.1 sigma-70 family RNA polymerase sigma factor [Verrucomicrobiota bacterium]
MLENSSKSSVSNNTSVAPIQKSEGHASGEYPQPEANQCAEEGAELSAIAKSYLLNREKLIRLAISRGVADPESLVQDVYESSDGSPKSLEFIRHRFWCRCCTAWTRQIREENHRFYLPEESLRQIGASKDHFEEIQNNEEVRSLLERLSATHREVLDLHYLEGMSIASVSRRMGRTEGAVKGLLFRARKAAKEVLRVLRDP